MPSDAYDTHIPALTARGVKVNHELRLIDEFSDSRLIHLYKDKVLVMRVEEDVSKRELLRALSAYATDFFHWFEDEFDYLMFVSNGEGSGTAESFGHYGIYIPVMNDTAGIGLSKFYYKQFGSQGRLRGVLHFPFIGAVRTGPSLHELMHAWANFVVPSVSQGHWGFSGAKGQLGGFYASNLKNLGGNRWTAGRFHTIASGGNSVPYSAIELYLAGLLPSEEVPNLWVAEDGEWLIEDGSQVMTEEGLPIFTAKGFRRCTIEDIIAAHGERDPLVAQHKDQQAAAILLIDDDHPVSGDDLQELSEILDWFGMPGADQSRRYNYYEATNGRGTLSLGGLSDLRKNNPTPPTDLPDSYRIPPESDQVSIEDMCPTVESPTWID